MDTQYDAVCILDADNLVIQNFLTEMNKHLCLGHDAIQGYIDSKNPNDTWISGNNSIAFWIASRMVQLPRYTIGLSCVLGGTGLVISVPLLKELGWGATCLAEDLEFTLKMVQAGKKVAWSHAAKVFDEKPLDLKSSWNQRRRWMQGHFNCLFKFFKPLFKNAVKNRDFVSLDMCIYLSQPVIVALNGIGMVSGIFFLIVLAIIKGTSLIAMLFFLGTVLFLYIGIVFVLMEHKLTPTSFRYLLVMPFYNLTWVPIIIQGFLKRNENGWSHTEHTRGEISIDDIKK
jgi:cellulose synthase/poly-beta-1,6-N-acetylglucosamine synthase-like glycosyltransferase